MANVAQDLETLARDCEECAMDAYHRGALAERRAWFSVCYRIRAINRELRTCTADKR